MKYKILSEKQMQNTYGGEAITLTAVMTVLCAAVMAVVIYRLFMSNKGSAQVPGGWKFTWNQMIRIKELPKGERPREKAIRYGI